MEEQVSLQSHTHKLNFSCYKGRFDKKERLRLAFLGCGGCGCVPVPYGKFTGAPRVMYGEVRSCILLGRSIRLHIADKYN